MTTIAILPEEGEGDAQTFSASTAGHQATGRTIGEALDTLTSQLGAEASGATVIVQQFRPDRFFTAEQGDQLSALMARWRAAREAGGALPPTEQAELERLVDEELKGATERSAETLRELETARTLRHRPEKPMAELKTTPEKKWRRAAKLHLAALGASFLCDFMMLVVLFISAFRGNATPSLLVTLCAINLLLLLALVAFERMTFTFYSQAEMFLIRSELKALSDLPESSARTSEHREQTKAR